jgi:hypothetical protein
MTTEKPTSKEIRDRICDEIYREIAGFGFSEPKAGKLYYLKSTEKNWNIYLEIHVAQRWGEYNVMPMFSVNWSRIREMKKRMEPERNHDQLVVCETFLNLMNAHIRSRDRDAWEKREKWDDLYVPVTGDIEPAAVKILDVFSRYGIPWLRQLSNKENARQYVLKHGVLTSWGWLTTFALIMETRGTEEACRWLKNLEKLPSIYAQKQVEFLNAEYCDGTCGVS